MTENNSEIEVYKKTSIIFPLESLFSKKQLRIDNLENYLKPVHNKIKRPPVLIADSCLGELNQKEALTLTEEELKKTLRSYNLREALITLGNSSLRVMKSRNTSLSMGKGGYRDHTGVFVTQFGLSYLANIVVISESNDWKKKLISDKQNELLLLNIYQNTLTHRRPTEDTQTTDEEKFASIWIRMWFEQFEYQFEPANIMVRNMVFFLEILDNHVPTKFDKLGDIFLKENGITLKEYFLYSLFLFACIYDNPLFTKSRLIGAKITGYEDLFTEEKVNKYLAMVSCDYKTFRELDEKLNQNLEPIDTKNRYNPFKIFPIIETDRIGDNFPYVVPNIINFIFKGFEGIYRWFDNYFQESGKLSDYRTYFGDIFEDYVGLILKDIYGEKEVEPEIKYDGRKFIDWFIQKDDKVYLFEVKAYQFPLQTLQTGNTDLILKEVKDKLVYAIKQVYQRISDIKKYDELKKLRNKKIIPIIVFMDIPFVSASLYKSMIKRELDELEKDPKYKGIAKFNFNLLNIEELEEYAYVSDQMPIEDIFEIIKKDRMKGFSGEVNRIMDYKKPHKNFVDKKYDEFFGSMTTTSN